MSRRACLDCPTIYDPHERGARNGRCPDCARQADRNESDDRTSSRARQVAELHAKGLSRNAIVRATGIPAGTVTNIARSLGLTFDRSRVQEATNAKLADLASVRADLIGRMYREADRKLRQLEGEGSECWPTLARGEGGAEETKRLDYIPARDYQLTSQAVGHFVAQAARLESVDNPAGKAAASLLTGLAAQLGIWDAGGDAGADASA